MAPAALQSRLRKRRPSRRALRAASPAGASLRLEIPGLGRRERRELAAVGLEIDERRAVEAIEAPDHERRAFALDERHERRPDRVRPNRGAQRKRPARLSVIGWALAQEVAARFMQPIERLDPLASLDPIEGCDPGLENLDAADRPVARPWRGQSRREVQGVRMTPTNTRPASNEDGASTATSLRRISFSLTMIRPSSAGPGFKRSRASRTMNRFGP